VWFQRVRWIEIFPGGRFRHACETAERRFGVYAGTFAGFQSTPPLLFSSLEGRAPPMNNS